MLPLGAASAAIASRALAADITPLAFVTALYRGYKGIGSSIGMRFAEASSAMPAKPDWYAIDLVERRVDMRSGSTPNEANRVAACVMSAA